MFECFFFKIFSFELFAQFIDFAECINLFICILRGQTTASLKNGVLPLRLFINQSESFPNLLFIAVFSLMRLMITFVHIFTYE